MNFPTEFCKIQQQIKKGFNKNNTQLLHSNFNNSQGYRDKNFN
jgi:hypothetical protein